MRKINYIIVTADSLALQKSKDPRDWCPVPVSGYLVETGYPERLAVRKASGFKNQWVVDDLATGVLVRTASFASRSGAIDAAKQWAPKVHELAEKDHYGVYSELVELFDNICKHYGCEHMKYQEA